MALKILHIQKKFVRIKILEQTFKIKQVFNCIIS